MDKTVLITGTSKGIGRAAAEKFLAEGWIVLGTSTSGTSDLKHKNLRMHKLDLSDSKSIAKLVKELKSSGVTLDALVNNAGIAADYSDNDVTIEKVRAALETNLVGPIEFTEGIIGCMKEGGKIVNVSSESGCITEPEPGFNGLGYRMSKASLNMYTITLARRLKGRKITVSSMDPGWVRTDMGGPDADRDPSEPAQEIYRLATTEVESGLFWYKDKKRTW